MFNFVFLVEKGYGFVEINHTVLWHWRSLSAIYLSIVFFSFSHLDVNGGVKGFSTSGYFCPQVCQVAEIS